MTQEVLMAAPTRPTKPARAAQSKRDAPAPARPKQTAQQTTSIPALLSAFTGIRRVPTPVNEPIKSYAPGSPERAELKARLDQMASERAEIPIVIGGREVRSGETSQSVMPHNYKHVLADWHRA